MAGYTETVSALGLTVLATYQGFLKPNSTDAYLEVQAEYGARFKAAVTTVRKYNEMGKTESWTNMKHNAVAVLDKGHDCAIYQLISDCVLDIIRDLDPTQNWMVTFDKTTLANWYMDYHPEWVEQFRAVG